MRTSTLHKLTVAGSMIFLVLACNALIPGAATPSQLAPSSPVDATTTFVLASAAPAQELILSSLSDYLTHLAFEKLE